MDSIFGVIKGIFSWIFWFIVVTNCCTAFFVFVWTTQFNYDNLTPEKCHKVLKSK